MAFYHVPIRFQIGAHNSEECFLLQTEETLKWRNLPPKFEEIIRRLKANGQESNIVDFALGPRSKWFISYLDHRGELKFEQSSNCLEDVAEQFDPAKGHLRQVVFGRRGTTIAIQAKKVSRDAYNYTMVHAGVPETLEAKITELLNKGVIKKQGADSNGIAFISIGAGPAWIFKTDKGRVYHDGLHPDLRKQLNGPIFKELKELVLSPYAHNTFWWVLNDDTTNWQLRKEWHDERGGRETTVPPVVSGPREGWVSSTSQPTAEEAPRSRPTRNNTAKEAPRPHPMPRNTVETHQPDRTSRNTAEVFQRRPTSGNTAEAYQLRGPRPAPRSTAESSQQQMTPRNTAEGQYRPRPMPRSTAEEAYQPQPTPRNTAEACQRRPRPEDAPELYQPYPAAAASRSTAEEASHSRRTSRPTESGGASQRLPASWPAEEMRSRARDRHEIRNTVCTIM